MAITGQFGRAVTGGSSMASSIANIASDFASLRISRIYEAFLNGGSFEGEPMDAQRAISLLSGMLSEYGDNSKIALDIEQTLAAVRKSNRVRVLNDLDATLKQEGSMGDWSNKVSVIEDMLLDTTLTPDERTDLESELSDAIDDVLTNAQNEFASGGKITVNGSVIDFGKGANEAQFLALFDGFIEKYPGMEQKIGREKDIALSSIAVSKASNFWLDQKRTTDQSKLEGYNGQLDILKAAYKALQDSPYGLGTGPQATQILEDIRAIQGYKATVKDNLATEAANKRLATAADSVFSEFDLLDKAMKKNPIIAGLLGDLSIGSYLQGNQANINTGLSILDQFRYLTGGTTVKIGNKTIDFSREGIYNMSRDAQAAARSLNDWASGNKYVSTEWQKAIKGYATATGNMVKNNPEVRLEDAYDTALKEFKSSVEDASLSASARQELAKKFGETLIGLKIKFQGKIDPTVLDSLTVEADLYRFGKEPAEGMYTFGEQSGNYNVFDSNGQRILTQGTDPIASAMNPTAMGGSTSLLKAIQQNAVEVDLWNKGQGQYFTDGWSGTRTQVILGEDTSAWQNGAGITLRSNTEVKVGETTVPSSRNDTYSRVRLMLPGWEDNTSNKNIEAMTAGWITPILSMDGKTTEWVMTKKVGTNEQFINSAAIDSIIDLMGGNPNVLLTPIGDSGNYVIPLSGAALDTFNANGVGTPVPRSVVTTGGKELDDTMRTAGYTFVDDVDRAQTAAVNTLITTGKVLVDSLGKIIAVDEYDRTKGYGDATTRDITSLIPRNVVNQIIIANKDTGLDRDGNGLPDYYGEGGTSAAPSPYAAGNYGTATAKPNTPGYGAMQFAPKPAAPKAPEFTPAQVSKAAIDFRASERASAARTAGATPNYAQSAGVSTGQAMLDTFLRNVPVTTGVTPPPRTGVTPPPPTPPRPGPPGLGTPPRAPAPPPAPAPRPVPPRTSPIAK